MGTRNADARRGSLFRAVTVGGAFNRRTGRVGMGSAGSVAKRLLKTTNTIRIVAYMGRLRRNLVRRAINCGIPSRRYSLSCMKGNGVGVSVGCTLAGSLNFNKRGTSLLVGGCRS